MNGAHDGDKLQEILDDFIQKFVLCPECENPETVLVSLGNHCDIIFVVDCNLQLVFLVGKPKGLEGNP